MSGDYKSITDGFILRILEPPPLLIIDNGRVLHRNLRMEYMSQSDLGTVIKKAPSSSSA